MSLRATDQPRKRARARAVPGPSARYDVLSAALSFGQDPRWRRALVSAVAPAPGERVLDVATGTGMVAAELLARSDCSVVGIDQSPRDARRGRARLSRACGSARGGPARAWS